MAESSPMLDQYRRIKNEHRNEVLFFRLGDFYEMFGEDAVEVSALINLTLTSRNGLPMCGVPYHASRVYIARLLKLGKKVAICEQVSQPVPGRALVDRRVIEVVTPGTTVDEDYLDTASSNYLAAIARDGQSISFSYIECSSGDFRATSFSLASGAERLKKELERIQAKELIVQESLLEEEGEVANAISSHSGAVVNRWSDWLFDRAMSHERLGHQFGTSNLKAFGLDPASPELVAAGALLSYLDTTAKVALPHVREIQIYGDEDYVGLDESTQRNLELVRSLREGDSHFTLLEVMNETKTSMGLRLLKRRILHPLRSLEAIEARLSSVRKLYHNQTQLAALRDALSRSLDLERLASRLAMDRSHARDLVAVRVCLGAFSRIEEIAAAAGLSDAGPSLDSDARGPLAGYQVSRLDALAALLERALLEEPSVLLSEGNLIRSGYDDELDRLRRIKDDGHALLEAYLEEEKVRTGISSLKIRYNRLIGYFLEVTKSNLSLVPEHFIRRQGVVGGERYTTDRLSALESDINGASEKVVDLERKLFLEVRELAKNELSSILDAAHRIASLDVTQSLAQAATIRSWTCPEVNSGNRIVLVEARHPVVEAHLERGSFVPNDLDLDGEGVSFALITGPNMAGKSTYLRQSALITLMAQMGSFVPAQQAEIGIVDRVFCRVGASDNLARGESTFLVEMNETAHILRTATAKSLVIMDEVGRGTGTNDGLSIAWAVCEELLTGIGARSLFATHYHELARLSHSRLMLRCMDVLENEGEIVFLKKIKDGSAAESYGLHVARLAGIPQNVLDRSAVILSELKQHETALSGALLSTATALPVHPSSESRACIKEHSAIESELAAINPDELTPMAALAFIQQWKRQLGTALEPRHSRKHAIQPGPSLFDD